MKETPFWMLSANSFFAFSKPALSQGKKITTLEVFPCIMKFLQTIFKGMFFKDLLRQQDGLYEKCSSLEWNFQQASGWFSFIFQMVGMDLQYLSTIIFILWVGEGVGVHECCKALACDKKGHKFKAAWQQLTVTGIVLPYKVRQWWRRLVWSNWSNSSNFV